LQARYNIAPRTLVDLVRHNAEGQRELVRGVRWGLIPNWWKKPLKELPATFNARVETVADKPMFRGATAVAVASCRPLGSMNGRARRVKNSRTFSSMRKARQYSRLRAFMSAGAIRTAARI
jgi:hypothetical protein